MRKPQQITISYFAAPHEVSLDYEKKLKKLMKRAGYKGWAKYYNFKTNKRKLSFWKEN